MARKLRGDMLGGSVSTCIVLAASWRRCDHKNLIRWMPERGVTTLIAWVSGMLYNQEDFDSKQKTFHTDLYLSVPCKCNSNIFDPLMLYSPVHWVIKIKLITFYTWCCRLSRLYKIIFKQKELFFLYFLYSIHVKQSFNKVHSLLFQMFLKSCFF